MRVKIKKADLLAQSLLPGGRAPKNEKELVSVFDPEIVVVQSTGMGRWLALELAKQQRISANIRFPFPGKFLSDVFRAAMPNTPESPLFNVQSMTWRLMHLLPQMADRPGFEAVRNYLRGERPELKRFQLASKIAEVFDRYMVFRSRMILDWDQGKGTHWQAVLWRELAKGLSGLHQPALALEFAEALESGAAVLNSLPSRVSIFGISTLPKFYLELLQTIAAHVEVHLFVTEPTALWWGEILAGDKKAGRPKGMKVSELGNPLLTSMGKLGWEFLQNISCLDLAHSEHFDAPQGGTMLARVQSDIFELRSPVQKLPPAEHDRSIQVHSCHSAMREVEVLYDQLMALLSDNPALEPQDVVVMMPDVAAYAPFIEAVFDSPENLQQRIPFSIAERGARAENGVIDTFLSILELAGSRFGASALLNILESPAVQKRFNLAQADLETLRVWTQKAAIRWGIDAEHRQRLGLPAFAQNTWWEGLDRLLLGYALPGGNSQLFKSILPCDDVEGESAETLGAFVEFAARLFETAKDLEVPRTLGDWQTTLQEVLERFFASSDEFEYELGQVERVLQKIGESSELAGFNETLTLDVLLAFLKSAFEAEVGGAGLRLGTVTFCALKPMRSIPFKVVALIGMNDTVYPRKSEVIGFDLMAAGQEPGDRSVRDEDRYLFLEALLSARQVFYLSFTGQSSKDNSPIPPSVLVSELVDYLARACEVPSKESLVTRHRLQPFNADYFSGNARGLFSYSTDNCLAGEVARGERATPEPFVSAAITEPEEEWRAVDLERLIAFYRNPALFMIKRRMGINLCGGGGGALEERESFALDSLTKYGIEQDLLQAAVAGADLGKQLPLILAAGQLPYGHGGEMVCRTLCSEVEAFAKVVSRYVNGTPFPPVPVDLAIGPWTLSGNIDGLTASGLVRYRLASLKPADMLNIWILHLALNCTRPGPSVLINKDLMQVYRPVDNAAELLSELLALYWRGLREPLRFFPRSSLAFAKATIEPDGRMEPREAAIAEWEEGDERFGPGSEKSDPYFDLAFRNVQEPLNPEWQDLALQVFGPLLKTRTEAKL